MSSQRPINSQHRSLRHRSRPRLLFFFSRRSGPSARVCAYMAQVLQHRRNHETFELCEIDVERHPAVAERFGVTSLPTLVVIEERRVRLRLERPRGCREIEAALQPWLR